MAGVPNYLEVAAEIILDIQNELSEDPDICHDTPKEELGRKIGYEKALGHVETHLDYYPNDFEALQYATSLQRIIATACSADLTSKVEALQTALHYSDRAFIAFTDIHYTFSPESTITEQDAGTIIATEEVQQALLYNRAAIHEDLANSTTEDQSTNLNIAITIYKKIIGAPVFTSDTSHLLVNSYLSLANIFTRLGRKRVAIDICLELADLAIEVKDVFPNLLNADAKEQLKFGLSTLLRSDFGNKDNS